jgi:hypothetical protein
MQIRIFDVQNIRIRVRNTACDQQNLRHCPYMRKKMSCVFLESKRVYVYPAAHEAGGENQLASGQSWVFLC